MGNLKILPEHVQLLNGLIPHLDKKGQAFADRLLRVTQLLNDNSSKEGLDSMLNFMAGVVPKSKDDIMQVVGKFMNGIGINSQKGQPFALGSFIFVFLILILLLQDSK